MGTINAHTLGQQHVLKACRGPCLFVRSLTAAMLLVGLVSAVEAHLLSIESYQPLIVEAAFRFAIPMHWIHAVIVAENAADPLAVSPKGAMGLMQIMPDTWDALRTRHGFGADPFAPADNILAGSAYLRAMLDRYGSVALMLAAYNTGPGRVDEHLASGRASRRDDRVRRRAAAPTNCAARWYRTPCAG
ncbi:MAG: lytic transglycosylase domain-containing protein [Hyphomicrobiales bacterium]